MSIFPIQLQNNTSFLFSSSINHQLRISLLDTYLNILSSKMKETEKLLINFLYSARSLLYSKNTQSQDSPAKYTNPSLSSNTSTFFIYEIFKRINLQNFSI
ncbi:hypothetical protein ABPG74_018081 [Tetrahymena malaccensis]